MNRAQVSVKVLGERWCVWNLHIVKDTPSTVRVSGAQTVPTGGVLLTALHWNSHHLHKETQTEDIIKKCLEFD